MTSSKKNIAKTILKQLGGNKFLAMTGAYGLGSTGSGLQMKLRRNQSGANILNIELNEMDTYDVIFSKFSPSKGTLKKVKKIEDAYCDMLVPIFEGVTGYITSL